MIVYDSLWLNISMFFYAFFTLVTCFHSFDFSFPSIDIKIFFLLNDMFNAIVNHTLSEQFSSLFMITWTTSPIMIQRKTYPVSTHPNLRPESSSLPQPITTHHLSTSPLTTLRLPSWILFLITHAIISDYEIWQPSCPTLTSGAKQDELVLGDS